MADMSAIEKMIGEMTDEEIAAVLGGMTAKPTDQKPAEAPAPTPAPSVYRVRMPDGTEIQAGSQEELNSIMASHRPEPPAAPPQAPAQAFDAKKYHEMLINDPMKAAEYLDTSRNGFATGQVLPLLLATVGQMTQKIQELESRGFTADRAELREPANRAAIDRIIRERQWQPSYQTMQDAFDIASARGLIKKADEPTPTPQTSQFVPPRVPRGSGRETNDATILARAAQLTDEQLDELMIQSGMVSHRHLS
jgi:hypothetical protein